MNEFEFVWNDHESLTNITLLPWTKLRGVAELHEIGQARQTFAGEIAGHRHRTEVYFYGHRSRFLDYLDWDQSISSVIIPRGVLHVLQIIIDSS